MVQATGATVVLDIGKTNAKLTLIDAAGHTLAEVRTPNTVRRDGPYPHHDTQRLWDWMLNQLRELAALAPIRTLVPVTHGATAALVDDAGLVLPVPDYEHVPGDASDAARYDTLRPPFDESGSPRLPAGLNLGRQLDWLQARFPAEFARKAGLVLCGLNRVSTVITDTGASDSAVQLLEHYGVRVITVEPEAADPRVLEASALGSHEFAGVLDASAYRHAGLHS